MANRKTYTSINLKDRLAIVNFLRDILKTVGEGEVMFVNGWNDKKVADHMSSVLGKKITVGNVRGARQSVYGSLPVGGMPGSHVGPRAATLEKLKARIEKLEAFMEHMKAELDGIVDFPDEDEPETEPQGEIPFD